MSFTYQSGDFRAITQTREAGECVNAGVAASFLADEEISDATEMNCNRQNCRNLLPTSRLHQKSRSLTALATAPVRVWTCSFV
jgi:hypothetical protein